MIKDAPPDLPSTNIVERLRDCSKYGAYQQGQPGRLMGEAAAEIERLFVHHNLLRDAVSWFDAHGIDHLPQWVVSARRVLEPKP